MKAAFEKLIRQSQDLIAQTQITLGMIAKEKGWGRDSEKSSLRGWGRFKSARGLKGQVETVQKYLDRLALRQGRAIRAGAAVEIQDEDWQKEALKVSQDMKAVRQQVDQLSQVTKTQDPDLSQRIEGLTQGILQGWDYLGQEWDELGAPAIKPAASVKR